MIMEKANPPPVTKKTKMETNVETVCCVLCVGVSLLVLSLVLSLRLLALLTKFGTSIFC